MGKWAKYIHLIVAFMATSAFAQSESPYSIVIDKSAYELRVFHNDKGWLVTYPVTFGNVDQSDKMKEGDKKTPEGNFRIIMKSVTAHPEWHRFMLLDYPTKEDALKFEKRKKEGAVDKYARIGGGIAIHGTPKDQEKLVDYYYQWTDGCISLKNADVEKLYNLVPENTMVKIVKGTSTKLPPVHEPPMANKNSKKKKPS